MNCVYILFLECFFYYDFDKMCIKIIMNENEKLKEMNENRGQNSFYEIVKKNYLFIMKILLVFEMFMQ